MQSKISFFNPTIFKNNLTRFWPFTLLYTIFLIIERPVVLYLNLNNAYMITTDLERYAAYCFDSLNDPFSVFVAALVMALVVFSYLYQSRSANMIHAFPVTRTQLFVTNYVSGLAMLVVPQALSAFLMNLVMLGKAHGMIWAAWAWFGIIASQTLFFYSFACLMVMFTGQLLTAGLFYLIWNFLYFAARILINLVSSLFIFGMKEDLAINSTSPLFPLMYLFQRTGFEGAYSAAYELNGLHVRGVGILLAYAAVGMGCAVLAWYIYQRRRIECAGDFLSMRWTAPMFRWGVVLVGGTGSALFFTYLFSSYASWNARNAHFVLWLVVLGAVLFFVSEMFIEKSFRVFHKKIIIECGACVAVLLVGTVALYFDLFGMERYVPSADDVSAVCLAWDTQEASFEETAQIQDVCDLQSLIVSDLDYQKKRTNGDGIVDTSSASKQWFAYMTLTYHLNSGKEVKRQYNLVSEDEAFYGELYERLAALCADEDGFWSSYLGLNYKEVDWELGDAGLSYSMIVGDDRTEQGDFLAEDYDYVYTEVQAYDTPEQLQQLYEAVVADLRAGAFVQEQTFTYSEMATEQTETAETDKEINADLTLGFETRTPKSEIRYLSESYAGYRLSSYEGAGDLKRTECYVNFQLNERCTHIIDTLIQIGKIQSVEDLYAK